MWQSQPQVAVRGDAPDGGKRVKVKAPKDPLAPKRPLTAFFLFAKEKRAEVSQASPTLKNKEVTAELGRMWKELGEEAKATYVSESSKAWKAFKEESKENKKAGVGDVGEKKENITPEINMEEESVGDETVNE